MLLSNDEWAVICTIHQEPKYKFLGEEFKLAQSLEKRELLQHVGNKKFSVTKKGEDVYRKFNEAE